jgi:glycosyltransferase involved in cell wall biosynthesis
MLGLRRDVPNILKSIDLFVLSTLQEAHGGVFVEAMAMGKPVIGTEVGGVGEVIVHGVNGYLVKPGDSTALCETILTMLRDRERARGMGIEGRKIVHQRFTVEKMCEQMYVLYAALLEKKRG